MWSTLHSDDWNIYTSFTEFELRPLWMIDKIMKKKKSVTDHAVMSNEHCTMVQLDLEC